MVKVETLIPAALALMALGLWLRRLPSRGGHVRGVDAWFYLLYAGALRRQRRLPAQLQHFVLDIKEQWYPPLFPALLALLPETWRVRAKEWVSPIVDVLQLLLLLLTAAFFVAEPTAVLLAGLIYAVTPTLVYEHSTLNSRALASLIFTLVMLSLWGLLSQGGWHWIVVGGFAGALLLLTHKMATQLLAFFVLALSLIERRGDILGVGVLAVIGAFALSGGFYLKVLRGHLEILRFWRRHFSNLNAHQVYDSPLYQGPRPLAAPVRRFYEGGIAWIWRMVGLLLAHNPWAILFPVLLWSQPGDQFGAFLILWTGLGYIAVILTTFAPSLRLLGEGFKYIKFVVFPLAILTGRVLGAWPEILLTLPFLGLCGAAIWKFQKGRALEIIDTDFLHVVDFLKTDPRDRIASIPCHACDPLAYLTGKRVLWGAHSAGYEKLEPWFPVIRRPITDVLDAHGVPLLLVDRQYVNPNALCLDGHFRPVLERGRFLLLERKRAGEKTG